MSEILGTVSVAFIVIVFIFKEYSTFRANYDTLKNIKNLFTKSPNLVSVTVPASELYTKSPKEILETYPNPNLEEEAEILIELKLLRFPESHPITKTLEDEINSHILFTTGEYIDIPFIEKLIEKTFTFHLDDVQQRSTISSTYGFLGTILAMFISFLSLVFTKNPNVLEGNSIYFLVLNVLLSLNALVFGKLFTFMNQFGFSSKQKENSFHNVSLELEKAKNTIIHILQNAYIKAGNEYYVSLPKKIQVNLESFHEKVFEDLQRFQNTLQSLQEYVSNDFRENLKIQKENSEIIKSSDLTHISQLNRELLQSNLEILNSIKDSSKEMLTNLKNLEIYYANLDELLHSTGNLTREVNQVFQEVNHFKSSIQNYLQEIGSQLKISNKLVEMLESHGTSLEQRNQKIIELLDKVDYNIEKGVGKLDEKILREKEKIKSSADEIDSVIRESLRNLNKFTVQAVQDLSTTVRNEQEKLKEIIKENTTHFGKLHFLENIAHLLDKILKVNEKELQNLEQRPSVMKVENKEEQILLQRIIALLEQENSSLRVYKETIESQASLQKKLLHELESIKNFYTKAAQNQKGCASLILLGLGLFYALYKIVTYVV